VSRLRSIFHIDLLVLLLAVLAFEMPALAADPVARAKLQSKGTLYAGQEVLIDVDVLVPNFFLQPPQFPIFDLPSAIVTLQDGRAINLNETIDAIGYSGIRRTYVIVPQMEGTFILPPAEITFAYAAVPGQMTQGKASLPPLQFTVAAAPGGALGSGGVVAARVTVSQQLDPDPKTLKAGDTLTRTITVRAEGLRAMMIPAPDSNAPEGVRIYTQDPVLSEEVDSRGAPLAGVRKDVAQYLFSDAGQYDLPAIEVSWFNPTTSKKESASSVPVHVLVADAPLATSNLAPPTPQPQTPPFNWFLVGTIAGTAVLAALIIWLLAQALSKLEEFWEKRQSERHQSEAAAFQLVELACQDGSAVEVDAALDRWSRKAGIVPLQPWIIRFGSKDALAAFDAQRATIYGAENTQRSPDEKLLSGLQAARAKWLAGTNARPRRWLGDGLPRLNPDWESR